jgi:hypothetical protein
MRATLVVAAILSSTLIAQEPVKPLEINFTAAAESFAAATQQYHDLWAAERSRIVATMERVTGLTFEPGVGVGGIVAGVRDVVAHRSIEQEGILLNDGQLHIGKRSSARWPLCAPLPVSRAATPKRPLLVVSRSLNARSGSSASPRAIRTEAGGNESRRAPERRGG